MYVKYQTPIFFANGQWNRHNTLLSSSAFHADFLALSSYLLSNLLCQFETERAILVVYPPLVLIHEYGMSIVDLLEL